MTHPHLLHATAAAWSLTAARTALTTRAQEEARAIALEALEAPDGLRGWQPLPGRCRGSHGDPAAGAALSSTATPRPNRYAQLAERTTATLGWLADQLHAPAARDPLGRLQLAMPQLQPGTCATLVRWLKEADQRIRGALGLPPDERPLLGVDCPACGVRRLYVQTAGPEEAWTVICAAGCACLGRPDTRLPDAEREPGCPCGMPGVVEGVAHIWPRAAVLSAVVGAAPAVSR